MASALHSVLDPRKLSDLYGTYKLLAKEAQY
jgi:hypothetical protein